MHPRFRLLVAVHLFLIKDSQVLLARRYQTGYEDGNYSVPAGHVEAEESCLAAMVREAQEEVGLKLALEDLSLAHVMYRHVDEGRIDFFFVCRHWTGEPRITEPEKCDALVWAPLESLPSNTIGYIRQALMQVTTDQPYSERAV